MKGSNVRKLSLVTAGVALALGSTGSLAQDGADDLRSAEVRRAEERLARAEDSLDRAEEAVEQREEELEAAREAAADSDRAPSADRRSAGASEWDDLTEEHGDLSTFVEALRLTGLDDTLADGTAYTVFAPTNAAFEEEGDDLLSEENRQELIDLLRAHIVADDVDPDRARNLEEALTVDGGIVEISEEDGELIVGDAEVVGSHITHDNVRIYAIDEVLDVNPGESAVATRDFDD